MGSPSLAFKFVIACTFLLLTLFQCSGLAYGRVNYKASKAVSQKVNLSVYYEALNISCASFIVKNLARIFDNGLNTIVNLRLIPWGNAHFNKSTNAIICQNKHFALIYCFEFLVIGGRHKDWKTCFGSLRLPPKPVLDCLTSINGTKLEQNYASETAQLNPPHAFVPWVVVNNQSIGNDYRNFTFYDCKAYRGNIVPTACQSP